MVAKTITSVDARKPPLSVVKKTCSTACLKNNTADIQSPIREMATKVPPPVSKFNVPNGLLSHGKSCLEKLKTLLKLLDSTTSLIIRSSKRWSMAAAISVGIDETDELLTDEDTLAGKLAF